MSIIVPSWFKGRQGKAEAAGPDNTYRLTAPNLPDWYLSIFQDADGRWRGRLREHADGPDVAVTDQSFAVPFDAWEAAFDLYRVYVVV